MKELILEVDDSFGAKYQGKYVFQPITWGKYSQVMKKNSVTDKAGVVYVNELQLNADLVMATLKAQPEGDPITFEALTSETPEMGLPPMLGAKILQCTCTVAGISKPEFFRDSFKLSEGPT